MYCISLNYGRKLITSEILRYIEHVMFFSNLYYKQVVLWKLAVFIDVAQNTPRGGLPLVFHRDSIHESSI